MKVRRIFQELFWSRHKLADQDRAEFIARRMSDQGDVPKKADAETKD